MIIQPLSVFRWRPKQRRMVTDTWPNCIEPRFIVEGKSMSIEFVFQRIDVDPASKLGKMARIYRPDPIRTPTHLQDIVLYVRI